MVLVGPGRSQLWASTQGLMAIQAGVAILASMDVVIGSLILGRPAGHGHLPGGQRPGPGSGVHRGGLSIVIFPR